MSQDRVRTAWRVFTTPVAILEADLTIHEKMAYIVIARHANADGKGAYPSYKTIAKEGSMGRTSAIEAVKGLVEKGYLIKETRFNQNGEPTSNLYTLLDVPQPQEVVRHANHPSPPREPQVVRHANHPSPPREPELIPLNNPFEHNQLTTTENVVDDGIKKGLEQIGAKPSAKEVAKWISTHGVEYVLEKIEVTREMASTTPLRTLRAAIRDNWIVNVGASTKNDSKGNSERLERVVPAAQEGKYERFYRVYGKAGQNKAQ